jgi:hypothetical protein
VSAARSFGVENAASDRTALEERAASPTFDGRTRTMELLFGERNLLAFIPAIRELRLRCGQQDDITTDPQYFIAANTQENRRVAAVLIRQNNDLEACVFFFEHCKFGMGLGFMRGGGNIGESLVAGPEAFRLDYVFLATQVLLKHWRIHGVSLSMMASSDHCVEVMGPEDKYRSLSERNIQCKLPLKNSYIAMLAGMGPRTRRSLAGKRKQLETRAHVAFLPSLEQPQALEGMLTLQSRSLPRRSAAFFLARHSLLRERPEFFSMGISLPDGTWLSILSGWRRNRVTYIDLQMNDMYFKRESVSAVMRAFMLEHEINRKQEFIHFVGGTSLLLRRYCQLEPCTNAFLWRPCLRATMSRMLIPRMKAESIYERVKTGSDNQKRSHH